MIDRWDDLRFLLALAREHTLTAAATALRVSQPTVGRHVSSLEKKLGIPLFEKTPEGYRLSDAGQALVVQAERIEEVVVAADRAAASGTRRMRGSVKLTAPEWVCGTVLAPALARFAQRSSRGYRRADRGSAVAQPPSGRERPGDPVGAVRAPRSPSATDRAGRARSVCNARLSEGPARS